MIWESLGGKFAGVKLHRLLSRLLPTTTTTIATTPSSRGINLSRGSLALRLPPYVSQMASSSPTMPSSTLAKRPSPSSSALIPPPPPPKRIKRPAKVLDEDDYTEALSKIIARDYFPGLLETETQQEFLTALESNNPAWIAEAGAKLRNVMTPGPHTRNNQTRTARNSRFPRSLPSHTTPGGRATPSSTPRGFKGDETPTISVTGVENEAFPTTKSKIDTSGLSLSAFQSKYTSEDNESFNALLDKQNAKRRAKHAHLWTPDQRIPSARQIAHRSREARLLAQKAEDEADGKALLPLTVGGGEGANRPARPDSWKIKRPENTFMFPASSVDEDGIETVAEVRERTSRAGPKGVVHANTRLPGPSIHDGHPAAISIPPSPSLSAIRDAIAGHPRLSASEVEVDDTTGGGETPRVNGYAFVDEDEPGNLHQEAEDPSTPTYRDLLAGQVGDPTPNPFRIGEVRKREYLHHRLVEREARKKRLSQQQQRQVLRKGEVDVPKFLSSPLAVGAGVGGKAGRDGGAGLTPAAKRMLDRVVTRTPVATTRGGDSSGPERNIWTPTLTPRRRNMVAD